MGCEWLWPVKIDGEWNVINKKKKCDRNEKWKIEEK